MAITRKKNLGLLLIEAGIIEPEQLEQALLKQAKEANSGYIGDCLLYASPSPRDISGSRMPSSA